MRQFSKLPRQHFAAILADPPWQFQTWSPRGEGRSASRHYPTLSTRQIYELDVEGLACGNAVLFLWVTWPMLEHGLQTLRAWGFTYKTCAFSWMKTNGKGLLWQGTGYWTRANTEACLLGTRGKPKRLNKDVVQAILAPRREHSRKPEGVHERIERLVPGPYLELFSRQKRDGWICWGNEVEKFK